MRRTRRRRFVADPDQLIRSAIIVTGIDGVARSISWTKGFTGVSDVPTASRNYRGGRSEANADPPSPGKSPTCGRSP